MENNKEKYALLSLFEEHTRGTEITIYTIAGIGLAFAIHRVRPMSKFSNAARIPKHFIKDAEILRGRIVSCEPSFSRVTLQFDHRPIIRIPFWHASKPPLTVQIWGIKPEGSNSLNWLQCIATDKEASVIPISCNDTVLVAQVKLHLPITRKIDVTQKKRKNLPTIETLDIGERLVELGMSTVSDEATVKTAKDTWWMPWVINRNKASLLQNAQYYAISRRSGCWQDIPSSRFYNIFATFKSLTAKLIPAR